MIGVDRFRYERFSALFEVQRLLLEWRLSRAECSIVYRIPQIGFKLSFSTQLYGIPQFPVRQLSIKMEGRGRQVTTAFILVLLRLLCSVVDAQTSATTTDNYLGPLTTAFTPDPGCWATAWAYDTESLQPTAVTSFPACAESLPTTKCCPPGYQKSGYYSPGVCPDGYVTHTITVTAGVASQHCCPMYECFSSYTLRVRMIFV
jgi:hypothetical protein